MSVTRRVISIFSVLLVFGWAGAAHAKNPISYPLAAGGGAQLQIGGGLPLPIQTVMTAAGVPTYTGTVFPPLLVPVVGASIMQSFTYGGGGTPNPQGITVPPAVISKPAGLTVLGQFGNNPNLYAVQTNLAYSWPVASLMATPKTSLQTGGRTGVTTTTFATLGGNNIRYSNVLGQRFGGPAAFRVAGVTGQGDIPGAAVTIYAIAIKGPGNPPCTHTALTPVPFPGPGNPACVAALGGATGLTAGLLPGEVPGTSRTTPGGPNAPVGPIPGVGIGKFGGPGGPTGTVTFFTFTPNGTMAGFTNMATSFYYPVTTGKITISAPFAAGAAEVWTITGMDNRTSLGAGSLSFVSGSVSQRTLTGPNANRSWIRLNLPEPTAALATGGALVMLAACHGLARRRSR